MDYDVVVAGAGPVGLMVASELALRGIRVLVAERLTEPDLTIKAGAINVPTAEALDRRGLVPRIRAAQAAQMEQIKKFMAARGGGAMPPRPRFLGHFGAIWLEAGNLRGDDDPWAELGPAGQIAMLSQADLEAVLAAHAVEWGVEIRRGVALTGFTSAIDGVRVTLGDSEVETSWLVGADGGRSLVRKLAGFDFPGTDPRITGHQALLTMTGDDDLKPGWNVTDTGVYVSGPIPGRVLTVEFDGPPAERDTPITAAELTASILAVSGVRVTIDKVISATRFTDNARQATDYRRGRVLLAGDAAHVHSPFGGQGLNLGMGDAMNLGWKLAAEIQGWAPDGLLDSYTAERHPIGAWVLDWNRAQVEIMQPSPYNRAIRAVVADLAATHDGTTYFGTSIAGLRQRYDLGSDHPMVGRSAPELVLADGTRLAAALHDGRAVLVGDFPVADDRLRVVTADTPGMLVRPDGIVAWVEGDGELDEALHRWFGKVTGR
ncbi:FAD-dependent monooxygenase [Paractinoplanes durhamensis]|uniref:FAD-dependent oxidoreductase n=1 Tax=Paractinoplanes durhamensis TaxID=113563 RepID=A0ABQ3YRM3_9ACTN|nr:FAD-dependent monooxygenase [Actinoplanes durhamensis]GIE00193.1 FAD-dependent oxidoreductase [Actinoplanes durhamensis]